MKIFESNIEGKVPRGVSHPPLPAEVFEEKMLKKERAEYISHDNVVN